jgi:hypothetical protein
MAWEIVRAGASVMGTLFVLFAEEPKRTDSFLSRDEDWVVMGLLIAAMLAGAAAFWLIDRWRKRVVVGQNAERELTDYRAMYERGEITEAEYARLRDRVAQRVKKPAAGASKPAPVARPLTWEEMEEKPDEPPPTGPGGPPHPPPPV